mmetsp:Transcript_30601/g.57313  ORF Transcript_30601/g.57313 Transcript_30601/m.57313 type:complete len:375 (+) Transcript_30601:2-1126(+)
MNDGFPALGYTPHSVKRSKVSDYNMQTPGELSTTSTVNQVALQGFLNDLKGGYMKGVYYSALERRRIVEKAVKAGSAEALKGLDLSPEEDARLSGVLRKEHWTPYCHRQLGYMNSFGPPHSSMQQWAHPSPPFPTSNPYRGYHKVQMNHPTLKHSPLLRTKDSTKQKASDAKEDALLATPGKSSGTQHVGTCYSPFLYTVPTPQRVGTIWEGDDAKMLHDAFSKQAYDGSNPPVTPGFLSSSSTSISKAPPSTATKFMNSVSTPRVFFKEQLTETIDLNGAKATSTNETPFTSGMATPCRSKAVTGSGPDRIRGNPMVEDRDMLLSTAMLDTPKSPKLPGNIHDIDQSLHHIDACIKSPLNFGSPNLKESPLRH